MSEAIAAGHPPDTRFADINRTRREICEQHRRRGEETLAKEVAHIHRHVEARFGNAIPFQPHVGGGVARQRSEEHTSELQSLMRISYAVFCLKKKRRTKTGKSTGEIQIQHTERHKQ